MGCSILFFLASLHAPRPGGQLFFRTRIWAPGVVRIGVRKSCPCGRGEKIRRTFFRISRGPPVAAVVAVAPDRPPLLLFILITTIITVVIIRIMGEYGGGAWGA